MDDRPDVLDFEVKLVVDGRPLSLKPFMHQMIGAAVQGLISGLKGVDQPDVVELRVERLGRDGATRAP